MRLNDLNWIVAFLIIIGAQLTRQYPGKGTRPKDFNYLYMDDNNFYDEQPYDSMRRLKDFDLNADPFNAAASGAVNTNCESMAPAGDVSTTLTTCIPVTKLPNPASTITPPPATSTLNCATTSMATNGLPCNRLHLDAAGRHTWPQQAYPTSAAMQQPYDESDMRSKELRMLVQHLYVAQARVQLEATEIHKAQAVAASAQSQLEQASNQVRNITAALQQAQQEVAATAIRAQIAQLQLAAHDQLLFAARQDVDALSSQMVGLQAAEGIVQPKLTVDLHALLDKLRQPLQHLDRPTPVPLIITQPPHYGNGYGKDYN